MSDAVAYLNGQFLPRSEVHLSLHDAGFVFGATATDLCRTFRHKLFRLADHLARFQHSCQHAHIQQLMDEAELTEAAERLVAINASTLAADDDLALVLFATPGPIGYYAGQDGGPGDGRPTLGMHTFPLPFERYVKLFCQGAHLVIPPTRHVPPVCVDPRIKQRSRLHWWIAEQEAHQVKPGAMALLVDSHGHVTETAGANFLIVRDGTVVSPLRDAILGGISLLTVEELCGELGIPFKQRALTLDECLAADEALLTCTSYCLAGVSRLQNAVLPWPGRTLAQLLDAWGRRVGLDIVRQILRDR